MPLGKKIPKKKGPGKNLLRKKAPRRKAPKLEMSAHCVKSVRVRIFSGPHFPAFALNTDIYSVNLCIQSKCGKMQTKQTPNTVKFYSLIVFLMICCKTNSRCIAYMLSYEVNIVATKAWQIFGFYKMTPIRNTFNRRKATKRKYFEI